MSKTNWFKKTNPIIYSDEFIQIDAFHKENGKHLSISVQSEQDFETFVSSHKSEYNIFYSAGLTDGNGRKTENIVGANIIFLDFDFKEYAKPPIEQFTSDLQERLNLFFFQIVDSGHGYHIYIAIDHTTDIQRWNDLTKELAEIYEADSKAALPTQLMRAPGSLNWKNSDNPVSVNVIFSSDCDRYSLDKLERLIERSKQEKSFEKYCDVKPCIEKMLNGVDKGDRNFALGRLIYNFRYIISD